MSFLSAFGRFTTGASRSMHTQLLTGLAVLLLSAASFTRTPRAHGFVTVAQRDGVVALSHQDGGARLPQSIDNAAQPFSTLLRT